MKKIYYVMGVSGSGKTTIGKGLAERLAIPFFDADDFHPEANIQKMKSGQALNDDDRQPWLEALSELAQHEIKKSGAVITCSALKEQYRTILDQKIDLDCHWIFLDGSFEDIYDRISKRPGHFMPPELLQSQFDTLEKPTNAIRISILQSPSQIIDYILKETNMQLSNFGVIGLGVMGKSLSLNLAENGFHLSLFNRHEKGVEENIAKDFIAQDSLLKTAQGFDDLPAFIASLEQPRRILIMIKAGPALDQVIDTIIPFLSPGDILIDGGNSHYSDTKRRMEKLENQNLHFIGSGISGGEEGARKGPSIMPGGSKDAYEKISPFLEAIAAKDKNGQACCAFIGSDGAGHFVKMVHNGIEYAEMQLIAEAYGLLRFGGGHSPAAIASIFETWISEGYGSYLLEITVDILKRKEEEHWIIDKILDKAGNKGTGSWTTIAAAELGVPITMITAALFARYTSSFKKERTENNELFNFPSKNNSFEINTAQLKEAYQLARIINHHQGFQMIQTASESFDWQLDLSTIARIWTNGCIIRSKLMEQLVEPLKSEIHILNLSVFRSFIESHKNELGAIAKTGIELHQSIPCFTAAFNYLVAYSSKQSTANIIQAQRDYFGAHTYQRTDDPSGKFYHTNWKQND